MIIKNIIATLIFIVFTIFTIKVVNEGSQFTALIALLAIGISLASIYYQFFNSSHQLSCTPIASSYDGAQLNIYCSFENSGTYDELVLGATFVFPREEAGQYSTISSKSIDDMLPEIMKPFILKPMEITIQHYVWNISSDRLRKHFHIEKHETLEQEINLKIDFVDPDKRNKSAKIIKLVKIRLTKDLEHIGTKYQHQNKLFEGKMIKI